MKKHLIMLKLGHRAYAACGRDFPGLVREEMVDAIGVKAELADLSDEALCQSCVKQYRRKQERTSG